MATTPTTPAAPTAPAAIRLAPPHPGARGRMTFSVQRLPQPLLLDQAVLDPTWNTFKTVMVILGGIAILAWLSFGSYICGKSSVSSQVPTASAPAPAPTAGPQWSSYADCQRHFVLTVRRDPEGACDSFK